MQKSYSVKTLRHGDISKVKRSSTGYSAVLMWCYLPPNMNSSGLPCKYIYCISSHYVYWGTCRDNRTSCLSHLRTFSSHLTVNIDKNLLSSISSFTFKLKILQNFISSQLTKWFQHDSQKFSMAPYTVINIINDYLQHEDFLCKYSCISELSPL